MAMLDSHGLELENMLTAIFPYDLQSEDLCMRISFIYYAPGEPVTQMEIYRQSQDRLESSRQREKILVVCTSVMSRSRFAPRAEMQR
jgi:hypothetical protein